MSHPLPQPLSRDKVEILRRETVFKGYHTLDVVTLRPPSLSDAAAPEITRDVFHCRPACGVLLYVPETDEILLNQEFRVGAYFAGAEDPFLYECSAGGIDNGETPEDAARREALEETGATVLALESVGLSYSSPGSVAEPFYLFVARIAPTEAGVFGLSGDNEQIKTHLFPAAAAIEMLDQGRILNMPTQVLLQWFARHHARLKKQWSNT